MTRDVQAIPEDSQWCIQNITYHKEGIGSLNVLASIVFLAFDPPVSPSALGTQSRRYIFNLPEESKTKKEERMFSSEGKMMDENDKKVVVRNGDLLEGWKD